MKFLFQITWILPIILTSASFCLANLDVTYEWKYIDYVWKSTQQKLDAIHEKTYNYTKIIPNDVQPLPDGRIVVTTPKYFNNPASVSTISSKIGKGGPLLAPYPNWSWHKSKDCSGITSVNRIILDECDRLWLVDSGKIGNKQVCPAKILAFDTTTDELLINVEIPKELSHNIENESQGRLEIAAVETSAESCEDTWIYISDLEGFGLVIWDGSDIWRLEADVFYPDPDQTIFTINGENITLNIGLSGGSPITPEGYLEKRAMLFKPMPAVKANAVDLVDLHKSKSGTNVTFYRSNFTAPNQELSRAFSKNGGVMVAGFTLGLIACWNVQNPLEEAYIAYLETNTTIYQFVSTIKITGDSESQTVWAMSNELQQFILGTIDWADTNFRIMSADLATLVNGTVCAPNNTYAVENSIEDKSFFVYETFDPLYEKYPSSQCEQ